MNLKIDPKYPWKAGLIVRLYIPFIRDLPKHFLILEVKDDWIVFTTMTSQSEKKQIPVRANKYVISYENPNSKYFGKSINYNTLLVATKEDFLIISQRTYRGSRVGSSFYPLNKVDFEKFKSEQRNYFQDSKLQKRLTKIIFSLSTKAPEKWIPTYLFKNQSEN